MALQKKRSNSSRVVLIAVVGAVVLGLGFLLFQQFYLNAVPDNLTNQTQSQADRVIQVFGEGILQDPRYQGLVQYGTEPIAPTTANPNPFQ